MSVLMITVVVGLVIGLLLALTGAGGSILAVPLLGMSLHLTVAEAAPVALLAVAGSSGLGAALGLREGIVRYRAAALIALAGILAAPIGLWLAHRISNALLTAVFALVLLYVSGRMWRIARVQLKPEQANTPVGMPTMLTELRPCRLDLETGRIVWSWQCARLLLGGGVLAGFLSGLLGVGGGFVIVPLLGRVTDLPMKAIVATSLAVIAVVSASGVITTIGSGHFDWALAYPFAAGSMSGMLAGRQFATRLPGPRLQQGFSAVSVIIAGLMLIRAVSIFY